MKELLKDNDIVKALENQANGYGAGIVGDLSALTLDLIHRQKAEIERLSVEKEDLYFQNQNLQTYIDNHEPIWKRNTEQAVKDTAKEIFTDLLKEFSIRKSCGNADVVVREMASRKSVEVE